MRYSVMCLTTCLIPRIKCLEFLYFYLLPEDGSSKRDAPSPPNLTMNITGSAPSMPPQPPTPGPAHPVVGSPLKKNPLPLSLYYTNLISRTSPAPTVLFPPRPLPLPKAKLTANLKLPQIVRRIYSNARRWVTLAPYPDPFSFHQAHRLKSP